MAASFSKLDRVAIRKLPQMATITERGITAEKLPDGDVRYSVNVMVDGQRIHRVLGRESEGSPGPKPKSSFRRCEPTHGKTGWHFPRAANFGLPLRRCRSLPRQAQGKRRQGLREQRPAYPASPQALFWSDAVRPDLDIYVQKFRAHCRSRGLSDATINRILATFRRMGRRLQAWHVLTNGLPPVKLEPEHNRRTYVISEDEEAKLLAAALQDSQPYLWLFIRIGLATGLRHTEILSARFDNFDAARATVKGVGKGANGASSH